MHGSALDMCGDHEESERRYEESLVLFRALGDERNIASLTHRLAMNAGAQGHRERARALAEDSLALTRGRFRLIDITNYSVLGQVRVQDGDVEGGTELIRRSADLAGEIGWDWWRAGQLSNLAHLALDRGDLEYADAAAREGLRIVREHENRQWSLWLLSALGHVALARGDAERAGLLWGAVDAESERVPYGTWRASRAGRRAAGLADETDPAFLTGVEDGRRLDLWDTAAIALGEAADDGQTVP